MNGRNLTGGIWGEEKNKFFAFLNINPIRPIHSCKSPESIHFFYREGIKRRNQSTNLFAPVNSGPRLARSLVLKISGPLSRFQDSNVRLSHKHTYSKAHTYLLHLSTGYLCVITLLAMSKAYLILSNTLLNRPTTTGTKRRKYAAQRV